MCSAPPSAPITTFLPLRSETLPIRLSTKSSKQPAWIPATTTTRSPASIAGMTSVVAVCDRSARPLATSLTSLLTLISAYSTSEKPSSLSSSLGQQLRSQADRWSMKQPDPLYLRWRLRGFGPADSQQGGRADRRCTGQKSQSTKSAIVHLRHHVHILSSCGMNV